MGISKWGVQNRQLTPKERWLSFGTILLVATLAALNMFKASPAIQYIASDMEMPQSMVSQIMGSYSIPALVFAYIGMWLGQKMGIPLYLAAVVVFGTRMFQNFAEIRRELLTNRQKSDKINQDIDSEPFDGTK